jgi:protein SCO1/2
MKTTLAVVIAAAAFAFLPMSWGKAADPVIEAGHVPALDVIDDAGRRIALRDEMPSLVFFGYTRCRDACPAELARLSRTSSHILFVTIDPNYDRPQVLARYLKPFNKRVVGITGTKASIERLYAAFTGAPLPSRADDHDARIFSAGRDESDR